MRHAPQPQRLPTQALSAHPVVTHPRVTPLAERCCTTSRYLRGLTLIELMVALAVFAVLGTLTYRGTSQLILGQAQIDTALERWRAIDRAMQIVETELLQVVAPEPTPGSRRPQALSHFASGSGSELRLLALSQAQGVAEVVFRHREGVLEWVRLEDGRAERDDDREPLLDGVRALRWRFLAGDGWTSQWPPSGNVGNAGAAAGALPAAVEINLELADTGVLTRIHALR